MEFIGSIPIGKRVVFNLPYLLDPRFSGYKVNSKYLMDIDARSRAKLEKKFEFIMN
jgi:hypothetical protein